MKASLLLRPILAVICAGVVRTSTDPITVQRWIGQSYAADYVSQEQSPMPVKSFSMTVTFDPTLVTPNIPGGPSPNISGYVPGTVAYTTTATTVTATLTPTTVAVIPANAPVMGVVFKCVGAGTAKFPVTSSGVSDTGAIILSAPTSNDTLVISKQWAAAFLGQT